MKYKNITAFFKNKLQVFFFNSNFLLYQTFKTRSKSKKANIINCFWKTKQFEKLTKKHTFLYFNELENLIYETKKKDQKTTNFLLNNVNRNIYLQYIHLPINNEKKTKKIDFKKLLQQL